MAYNGLHKRAKRIAGILVLLGVACAQAQRVPEAHVRDHASRWLARNTLAARYQAADGVPLGIRSVEPVQLTGSAVPFYLIRLDPRGYILMNGDRRLPPVVGFSFSRDADLQRPEDNAFYALLQIQHQKNAQRLASATPAPLHSPWDVPSSLVITSEVGNSQIDGSVIGPLLETSWDQGNHYNEFCPLAPGAPDSGDGRAAAGCVAVAFGQIMKYHAWPHRGNGSFTYSDTQGQITGAHTAVFSDRYEWATMQNEYYAFGRESEETANAVSTLMYELGVAAQTNYEPSGSDASSAELAGRIYEHFFYEKPVRLGESDKSLFVDALRHELIEQRPCVAAIPGHALVIDGYMWEGQNHFFHVNYGWSGRNDGWYLLGDVQDEAIDELYTGIRPQLTAIPLDSEYTAAGIELRWVLPETRSEEVTAVEVLKRSTVSGTFSDPAEDFDTFEVTSTSDNADWTLASSGHSGACFYKPAGGYGNREYHLTCPPVLRPGPHSLLVFKAKYILLDDRFSVRISTDDGATFSDAWSVSHTIQDDWTDVQIRLGTFAGQDIRIRFEYVPDRFYAEGGVWVDEIAVVSTEWYEWDVIHRIEELQAYRAESTTGFLDQAEDFSTFAVTSTNSHQDWSLSADGLTGSCFYKPAGGYSNVEYHLTSSRSFQPGPDTRLAFMTRYTLGHDGLSVSASTDGGKSFSPVRSISETIRRNWTEVEISLQAFSGDQVFLRFEYVPGNFYTDGGIWIDDIRLVDVTGAEYREGPVYHALLEDFPEETDVLAYRVNSAGQVHPLSEAFTLTASRYE